jgi:sec-independent protein translocase protein TatB
VLGPEKLPRVVSEIGRWVGRARAMARQFREQLEEEVQLEQARKAQAPTTPAPLPAVPPLTEAPIAPHPTDATGADPAALRAGATPSPDERGT